MKPVVNSLSGIFLAVLLVQPLEAIDSLDHRLIRAVQDHRQPVLEGPMEFATSLGRREIVAGGLLIVAIFTGPAGPAVARQALYAAVGANLVVEAIKRSVGRPRPDGERKRSNSSFPSGHAATSVAVAMIFARAWPRLAAVFWALAVWVGLSRMYLNRHFLSDVLVAAAIGVVVGWAVLRWTRPREPVPAPAVTPPPSGG